MHIFKKHREILSMYELYYRMRKSYKNWKRRRSRPSMYRLGADFHFKREFRFSSLLLVLTILSCLAIIILYFAGPLKPFANRVLGISSDPIYLTPTPINMAETPGPVATVTQTPSPSPDPEPGPTPTPVFLSWVTPMPIYENAQVVATGTSRYKLNVRTRPDDKQGEIMGILVQGQDLYILEEGVEWHKIVFGDGWGYAYAPYIRINKEAKLPEFSGVPQMR